MGDRRQARELALQALFFLDMDNAYQDETATTNIDAFCSNNEDQMTPGVEPYFKDLIHGVVNHRIRIDDLLNTYSKNWKISRTSTSDPQAMKMFWKP